MAEDREVPAPILADKHYRTRSAFTPENLLREARRQKGIVENAVPAICLLDPDGDIVRSVGDAMDVILTAARAWQRHGKGE